MAASNTSSDQGPSLAIIGGGIAGVTLVVSMLRFAPQLRVTLYEAAPAFGEIGAGVGFGPNAVKAMELIDPAIAQGFEQVATYNQWADKKHMVFDFKVGDARLSDSKWGQPAKEGIREELGIRPTFYQLIAPSGQASVHRAHFLDQVVRLIPDGIAEFGKKLVACERLENQDIRLKFEDGTTAVHNAVIGCDGVKSTVRKIVVGKNHPSANAVFSGKYVYRGLVSMDKAVESLGDELARNGQMYVGYHGHVITFPIEKGKTMNIVAFSSKDAWTDDSWVVSTTKEALDKDFEGWTPAVLKILDLMQRRDIWALFDHPHAPTYFNGRLALCGDAAHAAVPHQGAGSGMALEDAFVMGKILTNVKTAEGFEAAFKAYDAVRRPRTQRLVETSRQSGTMFDFELEGVKDNVEKIRDNLDVRFRWIWEEDLEASARRAEQLREGYEKANR